MLKSKDIGKQIGQRVSTIVKRLKASGLSGTSLKKALAAVSGEAPQSSKLKLTKSVREVLMAHVHANGPLVITGKKSLRIFSLKTYQGFVIKQKVIRNLAHAAKAHTAIRETQHEFAGASK